MNRSIPEFCEVRGTVGRSGPATPCKMRPQFAVSVEELSPLYCCAFHGREMRKFWGPHYDVTCEQLRAERVPQ